MIGHDLLYKRVYGKVIVNVFVFPHSNCEKDYYSSSIFLNIECKKATY